MFGKITAKFEDYVEVEITAETKPAEMPYTTAAIDNLTGNVALAPGSSMLVTSTKEVYVLNDDEGWDKL